MTTGDHCSNGEDATAPPQDTRISIDRDRPRPAPMSPSTPNRFIVEPHVLNAAFEFGFGAKRDPIPYLPQHGGGLPPPPRPHNRKGKLSHSTPPSPATSIDHSIASLPNSPTSSPYSNGSPKTPGSSDASPSVKPTPRLSKFLRGESLALSMRRASVENDGGLYDQTVEEDTQQTWSARDSGGGISPLDSVPSSPELLASPSDGPRPPRQNRYLIGLQKFTKLGRSKGSLSALADAAGVRSTRRMSDAELDARRNKQEQVGAEFANALSGRAYRRIAGSIGKMTGAAAAGESLKQPSSVPSSPIVPPVTDDTGSASSNSNCANRPLQARRRESVPGVMGGFKRPSMGAPASATTSASATSNGLNPDSNRRTGGAGTASVAAGGPSGREGSQPPPRARGSHGRQASGSTTLTRSSLSPPASDSSHDPPSTITDARISISSTIYPTSSNNHSFDISRSPITSSAYHPTTTFGRPSMSADRESFIDLASPTFSPFSAEFQNISIPQQQQTSHAYEEQQNQPITDATFHDSNDFNHGQSPSHSKKPRLPPILPPAGSDKPPIPTTPKPDFSHRSRSVQSSAGKSSQHGRQGSGPLSTFAADLDRGLSTRNELTPRERAQRVRTTHKLTQVFGQTPGVSPVSPDQSDAQFANGCMPIPTNITLNLNPKRKHQHHRPAVSMSDEVITPVYGPAGELVWPPPEGTRYVSLAARRHSAPLSPDEFSFMAGRRSNDSNASSAFSGVQQPEGAIIEIGTAEGAPDDARSVATSRTSGTMMSEGGPGSPTSFMDLSDEEGAGDDGLSEVFVATPRGPRAARRDEYGLGAGELSDSLSLSSEQLAEEERRRKREKLAKLHRFLGSRVPQHLVLGPLDEGAPLPPPAQSPSPFQPLDELDSDARRIKMRRRRSSSAAEFSRTWSDDVDRLKEELNEREKAINVRRAVKMEKMFGVAPPQTLYHTRAPTSSSSSLSNAKSPPSPKSSPRVPSSPTFRFTQSGSGCKPKRKTGGRPGTSDSSKPLMSDNPEPGMLDSMWSSVYMHYRHSLNSLNDIIDRDDRESLAELHDYLSAHQFDHFGGPSSPGAADDLSVVSTPTVKTERRRSLPARSSMASFTSEISFMVAPAPAEPSFQQRRRRAAKLTHFFGVDYPQLMNEILESIEKGLEEERGKGTLKPDEVKDLQQKLVSLKTKRNSLRR